MKTNGTIWTATLVLAMWLGEVIWGDTFVAWIPGFLDSAGQVAGMVVAFIGLAVTVWQESRRPVSGDSVNWTEIPATERSVNWTGEPLKPLWRRIL